MAAKQGIELSALKDTLDNATQKFLSAISATQEDGWTFASTENGVEVWKFSPASGVATHGLARGQVTMDSGGDKIWRFCMDPRNNVVMDGFCSSTECLQELAPDVSVHRIVYSLPWPVSNREFIIVYKCYFLDPDTRVTLFVSLPDEMIPENPGFVRGYSFGGVLIKSAGADPNSCVVTSVSAADMKGYLPSYLINTIVNRRPYLMANLRDILQTHSPENPGKYFFKEEDKVPKL